MAVSRADIVVSIPRPLTSLLGREQELSRLYDLLRSDVRLVTLTGFGGIGKTRLSLQAALELEPVFDAGAIFVPLAAVTQGRSMPIAIARTIGLDDAVDTVEALAESLGSSSRLLVLDNLEQIPDAAELVLQLLTAMPQVTILATSRSRLEIAGEQVLPLDPVGIEPAVQLFTERAVAANPALKMDKEIIAEICQRLDGIPLAIELAAARMSIFSLADLRDQLAKQLPVLASNRADLPDRQKTMRNAIAWTYDLLEPSEQRLFTWISVYEPDISLESMHHVAHQLELTDDPLDLVQMLVSRSLLRPSRVESSGPRYQMLEMLREFGHEQLLATNEDAIARHSHAMDMVALAERAEPHLITSDSIHWMRLLNEDLPNLLAAIEWSNANGSYTEVLRIIGAIWRFADTFGHGNRFKAMVPDLDRGAADATTRAKALIGIAYFHNRAFEIDTSRELFTQALALTEDIPDKVVRVRTLQGLGTAYLDSRNIPKAQKYYRQAQELAESIGDTRGRIAGMSMLRNIVHQMNNTAEDIAMSEKLVELAEQEGHISSCSREYGNLGIAYMSANRPEDAERAMLKALEFATEAGDIGSMTVDMVNLSDLHRRAGNHDKCREYAEQGLEKAREYNLIHHQAVLLTVLGELRMELRDYGAAAQILAEAGELANNDATLAELVHIGSVLAEACLVLEIQAEAAEMIGAVVRLREEFTLIAYADRRDVEDQVMQALDYGSDPVLAAAMDRGAGLDRTGLVARIQELSRTIVEISPPKSVIPERPVPPAYHLTPRETEVLGMLATGLSNAEIADEMFVSLRTVTTHLTNIFTKLDVNNRSKAVAIAGQVGLV